MRLRLQQRARLLARLDDLSSIPDEIELGDLATEIGSVRERPPTRRAPPADGLTHYERNGYARSSETARVAKYTICRVATIPADSWECRRHQRHILICLNERAEIDRLKTLPEELTRLRVLVQRQEERRRREEERRHATACFNNPACGLHRWLRDAGDGDDTTAETTAAGATYGGSSSGGM